VRESADIWSRTRHAVSFDRWLQPAFRRRAGRNCVALRRRCRGEECRADRRVIRGEPSNRFRSWRPLGIVHQGRPDPSRPYSQRLGVAEPIPAGIAREKIGTAARRRNSTAARGRCLVAPPAPHDPWRKSLVDQRIDSGFLIRQDFRSGHVAACDPRIPLLIAIEAISPHWSMITSNRGAQPVLILGVTTTRTDAVTPMRSSDGLRTARCARKDGS